MTLEGQPVNDIFDELPHGPRLLQFNAYVKSGRVNVAGEIVLSIAIPYEHKYRALPLTDIRGVVFVMDVYSLMDNLDDEQRAQVEDALRSVPDENPETTDARSKRATQAEKGVQPNGSVTHHLRIVHSLDDLYDPFRMDEGEDDVDGS